MKKSRLHHEHAIEWREYPRITPGEYSAYCKWAKQYWDPGFKRWVCLLRWDVLTVGLVSARACVPQWLPLGKHERPNASRRGKYLHEWVRANGEPPVRRDRLSPNVFTHRMARVDVGDTTGPVPYSVVRRIIEWETGKSGHSVNKYTSQDRSKESRVITSVAYSFLSASQASARTGVEGANTPTNTQGAGESATASPPKVEETGPKTGKSDGLVIRSEDASNCKQRGCKDA